MEEVGNIRLLLTGDKVASDVVVVDLVVEFCSLVDYQDYLESSRSQNRVLPLNRGGRNNGSRVTLSTKLVYANYVRFPASLSYHQQFHASLRLMGQKPENGHESLDL